MKRKGKHEKQPISIMSDCANNPAGTRYLSVLTDNKIPLVSRHHVVQVKYGKITWAELGP